MRLAPQTTARIAREVRELIVSPESGVYLVVDEATGLPHSLHELTVRVFPWCSCLAGCSRAFLIGFLYLHISFCNP